MKRSLWTGAIALTLMAGAAHAQVGVFHIYTQPAPPVVYRNLTPECLPGDQRSAQQHYRTALKNWQAKIGAGEENAYACATLAAVEGDVTAQGLLGLMYVETTPSDMIGVSASSNFYNDTDAGLYWLKKAADAGDASAALHLGNLYDYGLVAMQDDAEAARWYQRALELGSGPAKDALKTLQARPAREQAFLSKLLPRAETGDVRAMQALGEAYGSGRGLRIDYAKSAQWLTRAAEAGDHQAQSDLGLLYRDGLGVPKDVNTAVDWLLKANDQGFHTFDWVVAELYDSQQLDNGHMDLVAARGKAGKMRYAFGDRIVLDASPEARTQATSGGGARASDIAGVLANNDAAPAAAPDAAEPDADPQTLAKAGAGDKVAQFYAGVMYLNGTGVPADTAQARQWFEKAADAGLPDAQINLGDLYYAGKGVPQDYAKAFAWYQKAADQGDYDGRYNTAVMLDKSLGAPPNPVLAYADAIYLQIWHDPRAPGLIQALKTHTSFEDQAMALRLATQWALAHFAS